jgi:hypothetical protein
LQIAVNNIKAKPIRLYIAELAKYEVTAAPNTIKEQQEAVSGAGTTAPPPALSAAAAAQTAPAVPAVVPPAVIESPVIESPAVIKSAGVAVAADELRAAQFLTQLSAGQAQGSMSSHTTPMRSGGRGATPSKATPKDRDGVSSLLEEFRVSEDEEEEHTVGCIMRNCKITGAGTKENPIVIAVNTTSPELNVIFDIERVEQMKKDGWVYNGFHIRALSFEPDVQYYEATMCKKYEQYEGRAILISAPSRSFLLSLLGGYHAVVGCPSTLTAHNVTKEVLSDVGSPRKKQWYLLVFPLGMLLNNTVFSNSAELVEKKVVKLTVAANTVTGVVDSLSFTPVYWCITEDGTGRFEGNPNAPPAGAYGAA